MADDKDKKSGLGKALALVKKTDGSDVQKGSLGGALAKKNGVVAKIEGPQRTDLSAIHKAVVNTSTIAEAIRQDEARNAGICFVIDATGSRQHTWVEAQSIQARMFDALKEFKDLNIGIVIHRGGGYESLGWFTDATSAKRKMSDVSCESGETQIVNALSLASQGTNGKPPKTIIMVGDCFEENFNQLESTASSLREKKVKVYAFHEGNDSAGDRAYRMVAEKTNGVFKKFGSGFDVDLSDLCVAAAVQGVGGQEAFAKLLAQGHKGAKALMEAGTRGQLGAGANKYLGNGR